MIKNTESAKNENAETQINICQALESIFSDHGKTLK